MITINSRKYDETLHRSWQCQLLEETPDYWLFVGAFTDEIKHDQLGIIRPGTLSYEYYWKAEWFNVFRFHEPDGSFRFFYCNINMPPKFTNGTLDYIDLDIDVLVRHDFNPSILDHDEYEANAVRLKYPEAIKANVEKALSRLLERIKGRNFPFDCIPESQ
jgi:protein associated with RNAse G/E